VVIAIGRSTSSSPVIGAVRWPHRRYAEIIAELLQRADGSMDRMDGRDHGPIVSPIAGMTRCRAPLLTIAERDASTPAAWAANPKEI